MENGVKAAIDMVKMFQNATTDETLLEEYRKEWKETAQTVQTSMLDKLKLKPELRKELEELLNATTLSTEEMARFKEIWDSIDTDKIGNVNEYYKTLYAELPNQWKAMQDAVTGLGGEGLSFTKVLDEIKKYGQAQAGFAWLLGDGTADRETVEAVRNMVASVLGIAEDELKSHEGLELYNLIFQVDNMERMKKSIQNFYTMFNRMVSDYGIEIDFSTSKTTVDGLNQILEQAIKNGDKVVQDATTLLISFVRNGFVELGKESATVLEQTLNLAEIKAGKFDKIMEAQTDYGKMLGLKNVVDVTNDTEEALIELAKEWENTEDSVKSAYRTMENVPDELWMILDKGPANLDTADWEAFKDIINGIDPSKLISTNEALDELMKILDGMKSGNTSTTSGIVQAKKDVESTTDAIAAYHYLYDDPLGQYGPYGGTIDLHNRKAVYNRDGSISTERSFSTYLEEFGAEVLLPTIVDGVKLSQEEALDAYFNSIDDDHPYGNHLGMFFGDPETAWIPAEKYAEELHNSQGRLYDQQGRAAAQKALLEWTGLPETILDTDDGEKAFKEAVERKIKQSEEVYQTMADEIIEMAKEKQDEINKQLASIGKVFDWDTFLNPETDDLTKVQMLADENLGQLIPNIDAYIEIVNKLREAGLLSDDLKVNTAGVNADSFNLAKFGYGTFDFINKKKDDIQAARAVVEEFQTAMQSYQDAVKEGAENPEEELKKLRQEWLDTGEDVRNSLIDKMKLPDEVKQELKDLMTGEFTSAEDWEKFGNFWNNLNIDTIGQVNEYLVAMTTALDNTNSSLGTFLKNMDDVTKLSTSFTEAYDAFLLLQNGEGSESDEEAAKGVLAKFFGIDEALLETEAGMELIKQLMNEKLAEALEGNKELWEEFNDWLTQYNEENWQDP